MIRIEGAELHSGLIRLSAPAGSRSESQPDGRSEGRRNTGPRRQVRCRPPGGSFQVSQPSYRATLSVPPNHPELRARQTTVLRFDGEQREARVEFQIERRARAGR